MHYLLHSLLCYIVYVTESVCSFETSGKTQLCGWTNTVNIDQGMAGVMNASNAKAAFPTTDTNPGNENGTHDNHNNYNFSIIIETYTYHYIDVL